MPSPDVLIVGLGSTHGLLVAEDELAGALRRAGAQVALVRPVAPREVRTFMLTDLGWARAARRVTVETLAGSSPRSILYGTTTAALLWPRPGAIRLDAPAAANRPGRHGLWQRPLERRRLRQAPLLVPQDPGALREAGDPPTPSVVVPIPVDPSDPMGSDPKGSEQRDVAAVTYATNPYKKGLDRILPAWAAVRREGEELVVAGIEGRDTDGIRYAGRLAPEDFRALLRRAKVYVTAPRREDYGIAQLEALADGCRVVTTPAPGPYAALPLLRGGLGWVVEPHGLSAALRAALDDDDPGYPARARAAVAPFSHTAVDAVVAQQLLPALLAPLGPSRDD